MQRLVYALDEKEDFYGGRTGPLEKFYLFIYFLLIYALDEKGRFVRWPDGAIRKILFIYLFFVNLIYIIFN